MPYRIYDIIREVDRLHKKEIKSSEVIEKLKDMKGEKKKNIVWVSFPYSRHNVEIVEKAVNKVAETKNDYRLTFDENLIFVQRDTF